MKQITLLVASALLLLTACGQVESSPAEVVPPPTTVAQEDVRQSQVNQGGVNAIFPNELYRDLWSKREGLPAGSPSQNITTGSVWGHQAAFSQPRFFQPRNSDHARATHRRHVRTSAMGTAKSAPSSPQ